MISLIKVIYFLRFQEGAAAAGCAGEAGGDQPPPRGRGGSAG